VVALHDPAFRGFDMWEDWEQPDLAALRAATEGWFGGLGPERVLVVFDALRVDESGDMAVVTSIVTFKAQGADGAILRQLDNRLTWVLRNGPQGWRILHQHTSNPIDPKTAGVIWSR
jgi:ketosteroid isomerase-like protein